MLGRVTGLDSEALKSNIWACTLSKVIVPSQFSAAVGTIDFGPSLSSSTGTQSDKLVVLLPQSLLLNDAATSESLLLEVGLTTSSSLPWQSLRELALSCHKLYTMIDALVHRLPQLLWPYDNHRRRAYAMAGQRVIANIPPNTDFAQLCDEANTIKISPDSTRTWLQGLDEAKMRSSLIELSHRLQQPRPAVSHKLREYPSMSAFTTLRESQNRLTSALGWLKVADDGDLTARQQIFDVSSESYKVLSSALNAIVVSMATGRMDARFWRVNGESLLREAELATDYERVANAKEAFESLYKELTRLKELRRRQQSFTMRRLLPVDLTLVYEEELKRAFEHCHIGTLSRSSANAPSAGSSLSLSHSASSADSSQGLSTSASQLGSSTPGPMSIDGILAASSERRHLNRRINELEASQISYRRNLEALTRDNDTLKSRNDVLKSQVSAPASPVQTIDSERKVRDLENQLTSLQESYHRALTEQEQATHSIEDQVATIAEVERERDNSRRDLSKVHSEAELLKSQLEQSKAENASIRQEVELERSRAQQTAKSLEELRNQIDEQRRTSEGAVADSQAAMQSEISLARSKYEEALKVARTNEDEVARLEQSTRALQSERDEYQRQAALLMADLAEKEKHFLLESSHQQTLRKDIETANNEIAVTKLEMETAKQEIARLESSTAEQTKKAASFQEKALEMSKVVDDQNLALTERLVTIQQLQTDLDSQIAKTMSVEDEMSLLVREREQSARDAKFARQLHDESAPGVDPAIPELEAKTKEDLIKLIIVSRSQLDDLREAFRRDFEKAQAHIDVITKRLNQANLMNSELLRQQSLLQSKD